jgi:hypothetical protein
MMMMVVSMKHAAKTKWLKLPHWRMMAPIRFATHNITSFNLNLLNQKIFIKRSNSRASESANEII